MWLLVHVSATTICKYSIYFIHISQLYHEYLNSDVYLVGAYVYEKGHQLVTYPGFEVPKTDFGMIWQELTTWLTSTDQYWPVGFVPDIAPNLITFAALMLVGPDAFRLSMGRLWAGYGLPIGYLLAEYLQAIVWQSAGNQMAMGYLLTDHALAMGWLLTINRLAICWLSAGYRLAITGYGMAMDWLWVIYGLAISWL